MKPIMTEAYGLYHGDCCEWLPTLPSASVHLSVYSPPFCGLYHYSSSERDLSNSRDKDEFMDHYAFVVEQIARVTLPGRITAVHAMDVPVGDGVLFDFPGEIIRLHERCGLQYVARHMVWKPPLAVRMRTMARGLAHRTIVEDASLADVAGADSVLIFRKRGSNPIPIAHPNGFMEYAGARKIPADVLPYRGYAGHQTENRYSHWIWRQYASAFWDDVRIDRVLPFLESREDDDEKHVHPLQLDVIERVVTMRSNPGEVVLTPFMGVGSEVYVAVKLGRKALGIELKESYFKQAIRNVKSAATDFQAEQTPLFSETVRSSSSDSAAAREMSEFLELGDGDNGLQQPSPVAWKAKGRRREERERDTEAR